MHDYLIDLRKNDPIFYKKLMEREKITTVVMFGIENGVAAYTADSFRVASKPTFRIVRSERNSCPGVKCPDGNSLWMDGETVAIKAYLRQRGNAPDDPSPEIMVRKFINLEISDKKDDVGPPISILFVDGKNNKWLEQGPICPDIK